MKTIKLFTLLIIATIILSCDKDAIDTPCNCIKYTYDRVTIYEKRLIYKEPVICQDEQTVTTYTMIIDVRCNQSILK